MNRGTRVLRLGACAILWVIVAGCATGPRLERTEVTSFDAWESLPAERSYVFARTLEYRDSLELQHYEDLVRDELGIQGFRLAQSPADANLVVTLRPSLSATAVRVPDPWPVAHYWDGFGPGYLGYGRLGYGWGGPFGYGYDSFDLRTLEIYKRRLELDIDSRTTLGQRYYEGRVESTGEDDSLPHAMPILIRALFTDFPGGNGQTRRVDVPVERRPSDESRR